MTLGLCTTVMTVAKRVCTKKDKRKATHGRNAYKISNGTKFNADQLLRKESCVVYPSNRVIYKQVP